MSTVPKRLLIVDDDPGVVDYLVEMLEHQGYTVQGLTSPQRALDQIAEDRFDLVITDVEMPAMRGILIRMDPRLPVAGQCARAGQYYRTRRGLDRP